MYNIIHSNEPQDTISTPSEYVCKPADWCGASTASCKQYAQPETSVQPAGKTDFGHKMQEGKHSWTGSG